MLVKTHDDLETLLKAIALPEGTELFEVGGWRSFEEIQKIFGQLHEYQANLRYVDMNGGEMGYPRPHYMVYVLKAWTAKILPMPDDERRMWRVPSYGLMFNLGDHLTHDAVGEQVELAAAIVKAADFKRVDEL